jgi:predicted SnoaL-like aldol condensation-catalyzing enzyme
LEITEKTNLELVTKALGALMNGHDLTALDQYWTDDYIQHNTMIKSGREPFREFMQGWLKAMPDLKWEPILLPVASGNQVWAYGKYSGTFENDWLGAKANNKPGVYGVDIVRVENGKLSEHWDVMDLETLFEQMNS